METLAAYLPTDRRLTLARGESLPAEAEGGVLFADISGFTPLTEALALVYGSRRGVDELTGHLNRVYGALIAEVDRYGGSVIGFSGDAITCWFAGGVRQGSLHGMAAALAMQGAMRIFGSIPIGENETVTLAIKTALAAGRVRRFVVGDPHIQLIDVLAGDTLARMAAVERSARKGELWLDPETAALVADLIHGEWRQNDDGCFFCVHSLVEPLLAVERPPDHVEPPVEEMRAWILPALYERMQGEQAHFLAELRPAVALFLAFDGIEYEDDPLAGEKLNSFVCRVQQIVHRYEGALIQLTTGDKGSYLYVAFGAPIAHDDDSRRALAVALELRNLPNDLSFIKRVRIGISQGRMRVGAYGSETRRTYGVLGDEVNLAARLMGIAAPGQILLSGRMAESISDLYQLESLGQVTVKGKSEPLAIFAVAGDRLRPDEHMAAAYTMPLVGRAAELAQMDEILAQVCEGSGHVLRMVGNAGVGKTHLAAAFLDHARDQHFQIAIGSCQSTESHVAYASVRQIARQLLGLPDVADASIQIEQTTAVIAQMNPDWSLRLPLLGDLLGLSIPDSGVTASFDSQLRQQALIALAVEIVRTRALARPLLILYEDIHWIDEASYRLLLALARIVADVPILLLLVHRPLQGSDEISLQELGQLPQQIILNINELDEAGMAALVRHRLAGEVSALALDLIAVQAQGNPFFAEEMVDALREGGDLVEQEGVWALSAGMVDGLRQADCLETGPDGQWRLISNTPLTSVNLGLPDSIHGLVLARLDRLAESIKLTLKVASVVGRVFEFDLLARAHPLKVDEPALLSQLDILNRRDFARIERPQPRLAYIFKHNITQEVVYRTLLASQQQALHLAVAEHLADLQPDAVEQLAFHYYHGDLTQPAVRSKTIQYLAAAGDRAKRRYANETALSYYDRALSLEERWEWLAAKADVLHILGRRDQEATTLAALSALADAHPFEVHFRWGEYYEAISDYPNAQMAVTAALSAAQSAADARGQVRALARLGMISWRQGDYEVASEHYIAALALLAEESGYEAEEAEVRYGLGLLNRQQGEYGSADTQLQRVLILNRAMDNRQEEARTLMALGGVNFLRRNFGDALDFYRQALTIRRSIGDRSGEGASLLSLGQSMCSLGDYAEAEKLLHDALRIQQLVNDRWLESIIWNELGVVYMLVGQYTSAEHALLEALRISRNLSDDAGIAYALCNLGQIQREQHRYDVAHQTLSEGLVMARAQEDRHLEALYLNDLGFTEYGQANYDAAVADGTEALAILRELALDASATADLALLAVSHLALGQADLAYTYAQRTLHSLDACGGEGPDFPHRDYLFCFRVMRALGHEEQARHALIRAYELLQQRAQRISDPTMRDSFLHAVVANAEILAEAAVQPDLPSS
ncbi:MAG: tetratricopeptide repeat protein [Caldilineaceae bacterium]|nr:tetratricopeptide repeat protein [Caldilineaceae bacterium]